MSQVTLDELIARGTIEPLPAVGEAVEWEDGIVTVLSYDQLAYTVTVRNGDGTTSVISVIG